jgi:hypothetical protein
MVYETKMGLLASKDRSEPRTPTGEKNDSMLVTDEKSIDLDVTDTSNSPIGGNEMSDVVDDTPQSSCTEETFLANKQTVDENQHTEKPADVSLLSPCEVTVANTLASDINDSHEIVAVEVLPEKRKRRAVDRGSFIQFSQEKKARQPKSKKPKQVDAEAEFETAWICVECKEAECMMQPEATQLLVCDGLCRRLFHYPCAGLEKLPLESETFTCGDCRKQSHPCAICSNYGVDNEDVFKCSKDNCGLFFHESCLTMRNVDIEIVVGPKSDHKAADSGEANECWQRIFVCPAHSCWTCTQTDLKEQEAEKEESPSYVENNKGKRNKKGRGKRKAKVGVFECKNERFLTVCCEMRERRTTFHNMNSHIFPRSDASSVPFRTIFLAFHPLHASTSSRLFVIYTLLFVNFQNWIQNLHCKLKSSRLLIESWTSLPNVMYDELPPRDQRAKTYFFQTFRVSERQNERRNIWRKYLTYLRKSCASACRAI